MSASTTLREVALPLHKRGYVIIPIAPKGTRIPKAPDVADGKQPRGLVAKGWSTKYLKGQTLAQIKHFVRKYPEYGAGIITLHLFAIDIDVMHPEAARGIKDLAIRTLGAAPVRIGRAPKSLLLYRRTEPFAKTCTPKYRLPGCDGTQQVEVLADGQQFVAFATHPGTGAPYTWEGASPLDVAAANLPVISADQVRAFLKEAENILCRFGGTSASGAARGATLPRAEALLLHEALPAGAPPCLHALVRRGFGDWQNNGFFNLAVLRKKSNPDNWQEEVCADNKRLMDGKAKEKDVKAIIKSVTKKDYFFKCNDEPICGACNKEVCRTREFGIGPDLDPHGAPYQVVRGALHFVTHTELAVRLCNFAARIEEDVSVDDGATEQRRFRLGGKLETGAELPVVTLPVEEMVGSWWLRCWGAAAVVTPELGIKHLTAAIQTVSHAGRRIIYSHLGWRRIDGRWLYLHPGGAIGAEGPVDGYEVDPGEALAHYALPPVRDLKTAVRALLRLFELGAVGTLALAAAARAPLAEFCPVTVSIFLLGATGALKSALTGLAQACWGPWWNGGRHPANWSSTDNSIERLAFTAKDALLTIDDFAPKGTTYEVSEMHRKADRVLRNLANQGGRGRLDRDGGFKMTYRPRGMIIASGEDLPKGESLRARLVSHHVRKGAINLGKLTEMQAAAASGLFAEAMSGYLRWIAGAADARPLSKALEERAAALRAGLRGEHLRTPDNIASLLFGIDLILEFARDVGAIDDVGRRRHAGQAQRDLVALGAEQDAEQETENPVVMFRQMIRSALSAGRAHLRGKDGVAPTLCEVACGWRQSTFTVGENIVTKWQQQGDCIGWIDGDEMWLNPDASHACAEKLCREQNRSLGITNQMLGKLLAEAGWLLSKTGARQAKAVWAEGKTRFGYHLGVTRFLPEAAPIPKGLTEGHAEDARRAAGDDREAAPTEDPAADPWA